MKIYLSIYTVGTITQYFHLENSHSKGNDNIRPYIINLLFNIIHMVTSKFCKYSVGLWYDKQYEKLYGRWKGGKLVREVFW